MPVAGSAPDPVCHGRRLSPPWGQPLPKASRKPDNRQRFGTQQRAEDYLAQQAISPSGPWTQCYAGKASNCTVTGLVSGTQYWHPVRAIDAAGPSAWSDPATKRAT